MATAPEPMIGATVSIVASTPASEDQSGYEALSFTEIGKVTNVPEIAENAEAGSVATLKDGRTQHYNATRTLDPFDINYIYARDDAGQGIVRSNVNSSTEVTLLITDPDGDDYYAQGVLGNLRTTERAPNAYKGEIVQFRSITGITKVDGI